MLPRYGLQELHNMILLWSETQWHGSDLCRLLCFMRSIQLKIFGKAVEAGPMERHLIAAFAKQHFDNWPSPPKGYSTAGFGCAGTVVWQPEAQPSPGWLFFQTFVRVSYFLFRYFFKDFQSPGRTWGLVFQHPCFFHRIPLLDDDFIWFYHLLHFVHVLAPKRKNQRTRRFAELEGSMAWVAMWWQLALHVGFQALKGLRGQQRLCRILTLAWHSL